MKMLRLGGAPGVGKSATGWTIAHELAADGIAAAYVDIDQLGMCYPGPEGDPDRWVFKERVLAGAAEVYRNAGVTHLIVSGVAQATEPLPPIKNVPILAIWLEASEDTRRGRLEVRRLARIPRDQLLAAGTAEDSQVHPAWLRISTENRSMPQTVDDVLSSWKVDSGTKDTMGLTVDTQFPSPPESRVLWITGPRLAGASRIAWEIAKEEWHRGRRTGFADVAQLSFSWNLFDGPLGSGDLGLSVLASLYGSFRASGADSFVIVAPLRIDPPAAHEALPNSHLAFIRLAPSEQDLRRNATSRRDDGGALLGGDDVRDAAGPVIDDLLRSSKADSFLPNREDETSVYTESLSLADAVAAVRREAKW